MTRAVPTPPDLVLRWTAHPLRRRPGRGLAALGVILILALCLGWASHSVFWGVFGAILVFLSLEGFFLPTRYEIGERSVTVRRTFSHSEREWSSIRRVYEDANGLTLSPFAGRHVLEPYRALRLLFDGGDRGEICRRVREGVGLAGDLAAGPSRDETDEVEWIGLQGRRQ